jgi:hypothetical protein
MESISGDLLGRRYQAAPAASIVTTRHAVATHALPIFLRFFSAGTALMEKGYRSAGWRGALSKALETRLAQRNTGYVSPYEIATLHASLGDEDNAFKWLDAAFEDRDIGLMRLKTDFLLDRLRSDPRFPELVRKVGLSQ